MVIFKIIGMASILTLGLLGTVYLIVLILSVLFAFFSRNEDGTR